jgi:hypothetical protein
VDPQTDVGEVGTGDVLAGRFLGGMLGLDLADVMLQHDQARPERDRDTDEPDA